MKAVKKLICLFIQDKNLEKAKEYFDLLISDYPCLAENGTSFSQRFSKTY